MEGRREVAEEEEGQEEGREGEDDRAEVGEVGKEGGGVWSWVWSGRREGL